MRRVVIIILCFSLLAVPVRAESSEKYVALTFDDGPSGRYTRQLLDGLQERGVKATFLLCGYRIKEYPQETQRIVDEGHEIGAHGYSHKNMRELSRRDIAQELLDTEALLPAGTQIHFLRPPGGCCSEAVRQVAQARHLAILSWSVDPRDWEIRDAGAIERAVVKNIADGDIILLHDMSDSSVQAALNIIDRLTELGFRFVTVSRLAALRGYVMKPGQSYSSFPGSK